MRMINAFPAMADTGGEDPRRAEGYLMPVSADSFRQLTARLRSGQSALTAEPAPIAEHAPIAEPAPEPAPEPVSPARRQAIRQSSCSN